MKRYIHTHLKRFWKKVGLLGLSGTNVIILGVDMLN